MRTTKHIFCALTMLIFFTSKAQTYNYELISDAPNETSKLSVSALVGMDLANGFDLGNSTHLNIGAMGTYEFIKNRLGFDGYLQASAFSFHRVDGDNNAPTYPGNFDLETGAYLSLIKKEKKQDIPVVMSVSFSTNYANNTETRTSKFLKIPATKQTFYGARGGLLFKRTSYKIEGDDLGFGAGSNIVFGGTFFQSGMYLGVFQKTRTNVIIKTNKKTYSSPYTTDFFVDALLLPVNSFSSLIDNSATLTPINKSEEDFIKDQLDGGIGFRVGLNVFKNIKKSKRGTALIPSYKAEIGKKPYLGWYANIAWGFSIVNL